MDRRSESPVIAGDETDSRLPQSPPGTAEYAQTSTLTQRARRGALWTGASAVLVRLSNVLVLVVVARIIAPEELGVYALAITVHGFVVCIAAWGVGSSIGRSDLDADRLAPTVTTFAVCSSFFTACMMALLAGPLASALGAPEAAGPIRILALTVAMTGMFAVPAGQIQRAFRQEVTFRANAAAFVVSSVTLLLLVTVTGGAEAFAWSRVAGHLIVGCVIILSLDKRYRPGWNSRFVAPLLRFGVPAALGGLLSQLVLNVDFAIIGREMSTADLGHYMLAFNICAWPTAVLGSVMNEIVLPAFSGVRRDGGDLSATASRAIRTVALAACPIAAFTCAFSYPLIETLYGAKWLAAAPVVSVLALYGVVYVLGLMFDNIMIASGRTLAMFSVQTAALSALVPTLIVGARTGGLVGIAVGHIVVALCVTMPSYLIMIRRCTGAGFGVALRALSRPVAAAVASAGVALWTTTGLGAPLAKLAVGGIVGGITYYVLAGPSLLRLLPARLSENRILTVGATGIDRSALWLWTHVRVSAFARLQRSDHRTPHSTEEENPCR